MSEYESDAALTTAIGRRAEVIWRRVTSLSIKPGRLGSQLLLCHMDACPLDLERLLTADDHQISHDVFGIHNHLAVGADGKAYLKDCFRPRFAKKEEKVS